MATAQEEEKKLYVQQLIRRLRAKHRLSAPRFAESFPKFVKLSLEYQHAAERLTAVIEKRKEQGSGLSLLDIGSGTGTLLAHLSLQTRQRFSTYLGLDTNSAMVKELHRHIQELMPACCDPAVEEIRWHPYAEFAHADWDVILFSHSLYDMPNKFEHVKAAMSYISTERGGSIVIFHRKNDIGRLPQLLNEYLSTQSPKMLVDTVGSTEGSCFKRPPVSPKESPKTTLKQLLSLAWTIETTDLSGGLDVSSLVKPTQEDEKVQQSLMDDVLSVDLGLDVRSVPDEQQKQVLRDHFRSQFVSRRSRHREVTKSFIKVSKGCWTYDCPAVCIELVAMPVAVHAAVL